MCVASSGLQWTSDKINRLTTNNQLGTEDNN